MKQIPMEELTFPMFTNLTDPTFQVWWGDTRLEDFKLVEAKPLPVPAGKPVPVPDATLKRFVLCFESNAQRILAQTIFKFTHPEVGIFELFIVPVGRGKEGVQYEAIFNRI